MQKQLNYHAKAEGTNIVIVTLKETGNAKKIKPKMKKNINFLILITFTFI